MNMKPTPELINDWHEKARQMALQADGYFDDVEHWRHFAELAAAWGASQAQQTTEPLGFQIRRAIAAEDELRATKQTLEHAYAALQKVADAQAAIEEPELPEPFGYLSVHKVEGPFKYQFNKERAAVYPDNAISIDAVFTAVQMHDHFQAGVRAGMVQSQDAKRLRELLRPYFGYAPGSYMCKCRTCEKTDEWVDKRASTCKECADAAIDAAMQGGQQ